MVDCGVVFNKMERFNSWNSIKQTFSPYFESDSVKIRSKRKKITAKRKMVSFSTQKTISTRSKDAETSITEDSDEENIKYTEIDVFPPQLKSKKAKLIPLNASTMCTPCQPSKNISAIDSEDVSAASGNECVQSVIANSSHNRTNGCQKTNFSIIGAKLKTTNSMENDLISIRNVFNGRRVANEQAALEDSIIDTDTDDEDDADQRSTYVTMTSMPLTIHLDSTKSNLDGINSEPTIDSVSSFGSIQYQSQQTQIAPAQKSQRRLKVTKGGLTDTLQRSLRKAKSDHAFWMNERQSALIAPGERVKIEQIERSYGRILVHCTLVDGNCDDVRIFCLDPESKKLRFFGVGKIIEVEFNTNGYRVDSRTLCFPNVNNILI